MDPFELTPDDSPLKGTDVYWQLNKSRFQAHDNAPPSSSQTNAAASDPAAAQILLDVVHSLSTRQRAAHVRP